MHNKKTLFVAIVLIMMSISGFIGYYYLNRSTTVSIDRVTELSETKLLTHQNIGNPVDLFYSLFSSKDYRVVATTQSELARIPYTYFFQKGVLVRVDIINELNSFTTIYKDKKSYNLSNMQRTFSEISIESNLAQKNLQLQYDASYIGLVMKPAVISSLTPLLEESTTDRVGYIAIGVEQLVLGRTGDIKFFIDTRSGLIQTISFKLASDSHWNTKTLEYEEVSDIESLKNFPKDYKKVELD